MTLATSISVKQEQERKTQVLLIKLPRRQRLKPGPIVTAIADRSLSDKLALSSASCTTCN